MTDLLFEKEGRYLSLRGSYINELGSRLDHSITPDFIENRMLRDGEESGHHITVINHLEIGEKLASTVLDSDGNKKAISSKEKKKLFKSTQIELVASIINQFGSVSKWEKPIDLGLGSTKSGDAKAYYRVIYWPFGQNIRHFVGLNNSNFHITVGFSPRDVHQYKGPGTLLCLQKGQPCVKELYSRLIEYVPFYFQDAQFIQALLRTGWRHGYYMQLANLSRILLQCEI
ncbi:hypothetical protein INT46_001345 [Mucor plumbeus]|uniref:Swiss Army Knife 2H phosphoesterase domain-containing protein n=1 Tax=Mucor plumbeus TaxID=97098 RepID=A0A8H7QGJ4_9FUNG|nr:hypothetical protein INT46_001345 [Mucor plumbeus]